MILLILLNHEFKCEYLFHIYIENTGLLKKYTNLYVNENVVFRKAATFHVHENKWFNKIIDYDTSFSAI